MKFPGDMTWLKGKVARKFVWDNDHLVELEVWGEKQDGVIQTKATAIVKLIWKAE